MLSSSGRVGEKKTANYPHFVDRGRGSPNVDKRGGGVAECGSKKSRIRETPTLSTDAASRTNTKQNKMFFFCFFSHTHTPEAEIMLTFRRADFNVAKKSA